jgi:hypothetical protein
MAEKYQVARAAFEWLMRLGIRPILYPLQRLAGGDYVSPYTQIVWEFYRDGWLSAGGTNE